MVKKKQDMKILGLGLLVVFGSAPKKIQKSANGPQPATEAAVETSEPVHSHPVHVCMAPRGARFVKPTIKKKKNPWAVAAPPARRLDYTAPMNLAAAATLPAVTPRSGVVLPRSGRRHCRRGVVPLAASSSVASFTSSSSSAAAALIYAPTPQDRPLRTPHSG